MAAKDEGALLVQPDPALGEDDAPELSGEVLNDATATLLAEMPFAEVDELRTVVAEGRERGYLTPEEIAAPLEDIEPSREQVVDLHSYLTESGIDIISEEEGFLGCEG